MIAAEQLIEAVDRFDAATANSTGGIEGWFQRMGISAEAVTAWADATAANLREEMEKTMATEGPARGPIEIFSTGKMEGFCVGYTAALMFSALSGGDMTTRTEGP